MKLIRNKTGLVIDKEKFKVVKKDGNKGDRIPKHNHPEADVLFTVVKGVVEVTLNDSEKYRLEPGDILNFDGNNYISAELVEDSEAYVTLIIK